MGIFVHWLTQKWYQRHPSRWLLTPLSACYRSLIWLRHQAYHRGLFQQCQLSAPVIIIGNITVGGTGKTPFVIWLAQQLTEAGFKPGIISRGYGGQSLSSPQLVSADSDPRIVGDEPVLIAQRSQCPVMVFSNRVIAGKLLLASHKCDIIITDDGLQHYALKRDIEIVIVDGERQFGNQHCLPAGPLREPLSRLQSIDFLVFNGGDHPHGHKMQLQASALINLHDPTQHKPLADFAGETVHAVVGIGYPKRFFQQLRQQDISLLTHPFPDHHPYQKNDLDFPDDHPILMTEKDAVKCKVFASDNMWFLPVDAQLDTDFSRLLMQRINALNKKEPS